LGEGSMSTTLRCSVSLAALAVAAGLSVASPAVGADLPLKARPMAPPQVFSWSGAYLGAHGGWGGAKHSGVFNLSGDGDSAVFANNLKLSGALVGFQGGYNWDLGRWVFGIEGDISFMRWKGTSLSAGSSDFATGKLDNLASIRARIGIPVTSDRRGLLYVTGGVAWADASATVFNGSPDASDFAPRTVKFNNVGGVVGGGFEWAITPQWRARVEGLYYIFDDSRSVFISEVPESVSDRYTLDHVWSIRGGLSWYFVPGR
jgi:outer membrane immunogenic protein